VYKHRKSGDRQLVGSLDGPSRTITVEPLRVPEAPQVPPAIPEPAPERSDPAPEREPVPSH
jgi:hypothetical protein